LGYLEFKNQCLFQDKHAHPATSVKAAMLLLRDFQKITLLSRVLGLPDATTNTD
jgi:hypothetical protein